MRPIFMALYAQTCDFCDHISLYLQMYKQYFQMFCAAQEVCLKFSFYLPGFIIGAEFLSSCEGNKYTEYFGAFAICKSLLTSYFLLGLFTVF